LFDIGGTPAENVYRIPGRGFLFVNNVGVCEDFIYTFQNSFTSSFDVRLRFMMELERIWKIPQNYASLNYHIYHGLIDASGFTAEWEVIPGIGDSPRKL